ncbi:MAG: NAD(P)H-dependent oxidoreductase [Proteobacteria bacterium]|nr:NAD(P)H-dependent oxidoreductase [Pseudomonadota bacterium]
MYVLGLQGSPRKNGNTDYLLSLFLNEAEKKGADVEKIFVSGLNVTPCLGCVHCEEKGGCILRDKTMIGDMYPKIRRADLIVMATPVYFYAMTAQLKLLIDRCQMFWSRKYRFRVNDPGNKTKKGFLLSVAASGGKELFKGIELCADYFFDAVGAGYAGKLVYRGIEKRGDIKARPHVFEDIREKVDSLVNPLLARKKILFVDRDNGIRSRMAEAFAKYHSGEKIDAQSCGLTVEASQIKVLESVMAEKKLDVAYHLPLSFEDALSETKPDSVILMGKDTHIRSSNLQDTPFLNWELPDPSGMDEDGIRQLRDDIESKILSLKT